MAAIEIKIAYTIGGLARRAGVNLQTIRYYEKRGLLIPSGRKDSGYRLYDADSLKRLLFIRHAKELGFTLEEIKEFLNLRVKSESDKSCEAVRARTETKLKAVEEKITVLEIVRRTLIELVNSCKKRVPTEECPILRAIEEEIK